MTSKNTGRDAFVPGGKIQTFQSTLEYHVQEMRRLSGVMQASWAFYLHRILSVMERKGLTVEDLEAMSARKDSRK